VNIEYRYAGAQASKEFASLAIAYGAVSGKAYDALMSFVSSSPTAPQESEPSALSISSPGPQESSKGSKIDLLQIDAKGPGTLKYRISDQPTGISIEETTGVITGIATSLGSFDTVVGVESSSIKNSACAITFKWSIV
jgi:hypothetical protein